MFVQYIPHMWKLKHPIFERFAVLLSVAIVWTYAALLTVTGAYNNRSPQTQFSCRVDRSGLISGASWYAALKSGFKLIHQCPLKLMGSYLSEEF